MNPELRLTLTEGFEEGERTLCSDGKVALGNSDELGYSLFSAHTSRGEPFSQFVNDHLTFVYVCHW
jgi:hypothetical protein